MNAADYVPQHIHAAPEDFEGNGGRGRIVLLPGSDGRARNISKNWMDLKVKEHPRTTHLYTGKMLGEKGRIDVAAISTGMGAPSADIIIHELKMLGAKKLIRIGTAGSLQPDSVKCGSVVVPTGSVRDESTTLRYLPLEVPAVPSLEFLLAAYEVGLALKDEMDVHYGIVHSKDSLFAREFLKGPKWKENQEYMDVLRNAGVLASEMETSLLFVLGTIFNAEEKDRVNGDYLVGSVLAVIGDDEPFGDHDLRKMAEENGIRFCERVIETLYF